MIEGLMWAVAAMSVVGVVANILKRRWCFLVWMATNACWIVYDVWKGSHAQAALLVVYFALCVWGWFRWKEELTTKGTKNTKEDKG